MNDPRPQLSPREFVLAVEEVAKRTGKPAALIAERLGPNVLIAEPELDLSRFDARGFCRAAAKLAADNGVSISAALASLRPEDFFNGVR